MKQPRIVIAGTQSGVGKTSVTLALMAAFKNAGVSVQGFKVGPDYIDPSYHRLVTGKPSHNLDSWLVNHETLQWLFCTKSMNSDISIIEGVMGLYDGFGSAEETASTAEVSKLLGAPVILVLNGRGIARSIAAMVLGYRSFDSKLQIKGVILNRVASMKHYSLLKDAIESTVGTPVLGGILREPKVQIPERHLGLKTADENTEFKDCIECLAQLTQKNQIQPGIDLEKIYKIASETAPLENNIQIENKFKQVQEDPKIRIGIAQDRAFNFYYQANLDLLTECGAELVPFSPLADPCLPDRCRALYFGGGFPELYAEVLSNNISLKKQIRDSISSGLPVYAECGGLMYLSESIETKEGLSFPMVGSVTGKIIMTQKLQNFGYKEGRVIQNTILSDKDDRIRGHEFHYSKRDAPDHAENYSYDLYSKRTGDKQMEGYTSGSILASYLHIHFLTNPVWAIKFINSAKNYQNLADRKEVSI